MRGSRAVPLLVFVFAAIGCGPRDPLERSVSVPTPNRFAAWRSHLASDSNPDTVRRVEQALQEIRLNIAGERELKRQLEDTAAGGKEAIDEAVRQRVHGLRLREVLQLGGELRVRRLQEELAGLEAAMDQNARLVTRPGDLESRHHLEALQERQQVRVEKYREDLAATKRELAPLLAKAGRSLLDVGSSSAAPATKPAP